MIEVKNVTKKYGKFVAVDDISFTINEGEIVGLLGPNGAGKSTTMNMITGFIEQTEGEIIVDGYDMLRKAKKAKKEIGYMPEGVPLYTDLTVREFVTYMAEIKQIDKKTRKEEVQKIIEQTGLKEVEKKLVRNLSRGYKQRVSMAGALVGNPKILILDEPTVGLDPKQITEIRSLIKELGKTHTVIVAVDTPENLENKVTNNNSVYVTVEDSENKIQRIQERVKDIKKIELVHKNEDGTKQYVIETNGEADLRKTIFAELAKENITVFEMKKADATLEDAFMKLIEGGKQ